MRTRSWIRIAASAALVLPCAALSQPAVAAPAAFAPEDPAQARVTVATEDKLALAATYYAPIGAKQKAPGAVLIHGQQGSRKDLDALAVRLSKLGFAVLTVDLRGHGESATEALDWKKLDAQARTRAWAFAARDVKAAVQFLLDQKGVHSTTVSLVGLGDGCTLVARQATRDERVRDLVLVSPALEPSPPGGAGATGGAPAAAPGGSLVKDLIELSGLPVYVAVGKEDAAVAKRIAESTRRAQEESTLETAIAKVSAAEMLSDNKYAGDLARWMKSKALPGPLPEAKPVR